MQEMQLLHRYKKLIYFCGNDEILSSKLTSLVSFSRNLLQNHSRNDIILFLYFLQMQHMSLHRLATLPPGGARNAKEKHTLIFNYKTGTFGMHPMSIWRARQT